MVAGVDYAAEQAYTSRLVRDLAALDFRRWVQQLSRLGISEREAARRVGVSQPALHKALQVAGRDPELIEGFKGASLTEICQRYRVGQFDRAELIDQLVRFPYAEEETSDGYDWLSVDSPGTWSEVCAALEAGWIDESIYEEVFNRIHGG